MSDAPPLPPLGEDPSAGAETPDSPEADFTQMPQGLAEGRLILGRFRLQRQLGRGGMGVVWLAQDTRLADRPIALKFLPELIAIDDEAIADLRREIRYGLDINHPGIVRVYDLHESRTEGIAAIAMEYIEGPSLSGLKAKRTERCFDPAELMEWVQQLCEILAYLHEEAGVVHRDLKPGNLMVTAKGRLKLADFGIAAAISESHSRLSAVSGRAGGSGTPHYMSPQQFVGRSVKPSDDIYAVGATLYDLVTGRPPFFRAHGNAIFHVIHTEVAPSMAQRRAELGVHGRPEIPAAWELTVAACLAKTPEERPLTVRCLLASLTAEPPLQEETTSLAPAPGSAEETGPPSQEQTVETPPAVREESVPRPTPEWIDESPVAEPAIPPPPPPLSPLHFRRIFLACGAMVFASGYLSNLVSVNLVSACTSAGFILGVLCRGWLKDRRGERMSFWLGFVLLCLGAAAVGSQGLAPRAVLSWPVSIAAMLACAGNGMWFVLAIQISASAAPQQVFRRTALLGAWAYLGRSASSFLLNKMWSAGSTSDWASPGPIYICAIALLGVGCALFLGLPASALGKRGLLFVERLPFSVKSLVLAGWLAAIYVTVAVQSTGVVLRLFGNGAEIASIVALLILGLILGVYLPRRFGGKLPHLEQGGFLAVISAVLAGAVLFGNLMVGRRTFDYRPGLPLFLNLLALLMAFVLPRLAARWRLSFTQLLVGSAALSATAYVCVGGALSTAFIWCFAATQPAQSMLWAAVLAGYAAQQDRLRGVVVGVLLAVTWMAFFVFDAATWYFLSRLASDPAGGQGESMLFLIFPRTHAAVSNESWAKLHYYLPVLAVVISAIVLWLAARSYRRPCEGEPVSR